MRAQGLLWMVAAAGGLALAGCSRSGGGSAGAAKEPRINGAPSDPPVALAVKWAPGKQYVLRVEMSQSADVDSRGRRRAGGTQTTFAQEFSLTTTNVAEEQCGLDLELLSVELQETKGDRTVLSYDSLNEVWGTEGNPTAEALAKLVGGHVQYRLGPENKVLAVDGLREFYARVDGPAREATTTAASRPGRELRAKRFSLGGGGKLKRYDNFEGFKQMLELSCPPAKPLRIGESWTMQFEVSPGVFSGARFLTVTNVFRGWQQHDRKNCARIDFTGVSGAKPDASSVQLERNSKGRSDRGYSADERRSGGEGGGSITGKYWFDPEQGLPMEVVLEQVSTRTIKGGGGKGGSNAPPRSATSATRQAFSFKLTDTTLAAN